MSAPITDFSKPVQQQSFFQRNKIAIILAAVVIVASIVGVALYFILRNRDFGVEFSAFVPATGIVAKITNKTSKAIKVDWAYATVKYKYWVIDESVMADFEIKPNETVTLNKESYELCIKSKKIPKEVEKRLKKKTDKRLNNPFAAMKQAIEIAGSEKLKLDRKVVVKYGDKLFKWSDQVEGSAKWALLKK